MLAAVVAAEAAVVVMVVVVVVVVIYGDEDFWYRGALDVFEVRIRDKQG